LQLVLHDHFFNTGLPGQSVKVRGCVWEVQDRAVQRTSVFLNAPFPWYQFPGLKTLSASKVLVWKRLKALQMYLSAC